MDEFAKKLRGDITEKTMEAIKKEGQPVFFGKCEGADNDGGWAEFNVSLIAQKVIEQQEKKKDDYTVARFHDHPREVWINIRSIDLCEESNDNEIVLLYSDDEIIPHFRVIHDYNSNSKEITIPKDCIDAFIAALTRLKNDPLVLKYTQRNFKVEEHYK